MSKEEQALDLARKLHIWYEDVAKEEGWNTQESCKVDFDELPLKNKVTMVRVAEKILQEKELELKAEQIKNRMIEMETASATNPNLMQDYKVLWENLKKEISKEG